MGSSDDPNSNEKAIDASVGGLVWVQRRNGSWWPGQIMGLDEISEGSLVSPKSGTPVKLLGREDAIVDWYNLEKSKRVKAFRCGEYDECIEKARAAAANGNKKVVKYARREDAILHALEIENARLGKDSLEFARIDNSGVDHPSSVKESPNMSLSGKVEDKETINERTGTRDGSDSGVIVDSDSGPDADSDSAPELSQSGISFEEPNHVGTSKVQPSLSKRRRTPNDSEDDGTEGIKRMRGLEDLGMGVGDSNTGNCMSNGSAVNGISNSLKRKRSQVANVHELLKRKNRRRPLTKVLESTAMVSTPVICDQLPNSNGSPLHGLSDSKVSGLESTESRKNSSLAIHNNVDGVRVSLENGVLLNPSEDPCNVSHKNSNTKKENDIPDKSGLAENDNPDRLLNGPFVGEIKNSAGASPVSSSFGKHQTGLGRQATQSSQAEAVSLKNEGVNESGPLSSATAHVNNGGQRMEKGTSKWQWKGKRNSRRKSKNRKHASRKYMGMNDEGRAYLASIGQKVGCDGTGRSPVLQTCNSQVKAKSFLEDPRNGIREWSNSLSQREPHKRGLATEVSVPPQRSLPYRQSRFTVNSKYQSSDIPGRNFSTNSKLYDVELEVKANYRPQHVPLVSLMSKLNGKAIVGHPLVVECLDDGYCDDMIADECNATAHETADMGYPAMRNSESGRNAAKHMAMQSQLSPSKSSKLKKSGLLSKKIRKLSSLTGTRVENRKLVVEKPKGPVIACIPLKLVFSRINEAVNGSARPPQRTLTSSNS